MRKTAKSKIPLPLVLLNDTARLLLRVFFKRKKFSGAGGYNSPFFIIGCGRSGNTLLRSMLVAGGEVSIPPESYIWPRLIRRFQLYSFLPWDTLSSLMVSEFEAYKEFYTWEVNLFSAHQSARALEGPNRNLAGIINEVYQCYIRQKAQNASRWGDKTPINTLYADKILKIFPRAQFVYIERDPRDVACSYRKAGLYDNLKEPAMFWYRSSTMARKLQKTLPPSQFQLVRYEDLVTNPEAELKRICDFLAIRYSASMLDFYKSADKLGDVKFGNHHKNVKSPVSTSSIGKWKDELSAEERQLVESLTIDKSPLM